MTTLVTVEGWIKADLTYATLKYKSNTMNMYTKLLNNLKKQSYNCYIYVYKKQTVMYG